MRPSSSWSAVVLLPIAVAALLIVPTETFFLGSKTSFTTSPPHALASRTRRMVANVAMQEQEETTKVTSRAKEVTTAHRRAVFATTAGALTSSWLLSSSSSSSPNKGQAATLPTAASPTTPVVKGNGVCNDAISHLRNPKTGQDIYMIGTAHISNESAILVRSTIRALRPQTVMLELDASRIGRLASADNSTSVPPSSPSASTTITASSATQDPSLPPIKFIIPPPPLGSILPPTNAPSLLPKQGEGKKGFLKAALGELTRAGSNFREKLIGVGAVVVGQVISGLYRGLDKMGFVSGQEFIVAMEEGRKVGADLLLGDQNVQVTLRRLSDALSKSELVKVREMESPTRSPAARELEARGIKMGGNDKAELAVAVEALKERASVRALMSTLQSELPEVYKAMIEERDAYMSASLLGCKSKVIVGVVGIGHLDGIERNLGREGFVSVPCRLAQGQ
ncbi:hypothetical protein VYU27_004485 [Nannochloropsis oceanica]